MSSTDLGSNMEDVWDESGLTAGYFRVTSGLRPGYIGVRLWFCMTLDIDE